MPRGLSKPFIRWTSYSYDEYTMSENFFIVESVAQVKAYLKSRTPETFKTWLQDIRTASNNTDPINSMLTYEYYSEGMDKPYKNDITPFLITATPGENEKYKENLYYLLSNYDRNSNWHWCKEINALQNSTLDKMWKAKFLSLCKVAGGRKTKNNKNNRKNRKSRRSK
jgi:hypothetical protein